MSDKRAAIFHGTNDDPSKYWLPWIKNLLNESGYSVYAPTLPNNDKPNKATYEAFIKDSQWDFTDNILVGHSSGATTILNLLSSGWFPNVKAIILVGTFLNEKLTKHVDWYIPGQFDNLFMDEYNPDILKQKSEKFYFVHGDNDPYCDIVDAKKLSNKLNGQFITIPNGHHLGGTSMRKSLHELEVVLREDGIIS